MSDRITEDGLLGRRVRLRQPRSGYRVSIDTPLLAAAIPAKAGDRVVDFGCGAGGAALCLLARVSGVNVTGVEANGDFARLARENATLNRAETAFVVEQGSIKDFAGERFDHAMANPPYYAGGTRALDSGKDAAHRLAETVLDDWVAASARAVKPGGSMTFILPANLEGPLIRSYARRQIGDIRILPLLPKEGRPPKRIIAVGRLKGAPGVEQLKGFVLHKEDGSFTAAARDILWNVSPLLPLGA